MAIFFKWTWVSQYHNVSILEFIEAKDDGVGDDHWSYANMQISNQAVTINNKLFTGPMPFMMPNQVSGHKREICR